MDNVSLEIVEDNKDLGLIINNNFSWSSHIDLKLAKSNKTFTFYGEMCLFKLNSNVNSYSIDYQLYPCYSLAPLHDHLQYTAFADSKVLKNAFFNGCQIRMTMTYANRCST